jgi:dihydropteroate synthase
MTEPDPSDRPEALEPLGFVSGRIALDMCEAGWAFAMAGGPLAFTHARWRGDLLNAEALRRRAIHENMDEDGALTAALEAVTRPRPAFAGLALSGALARPRLMGVCNVTPDSFSDGGEHADPAAAITFGRELAAAGADIIDVGGESTRPGAQPVSEDEECARVVPVVEALAADGLVVSIDTRHAGVMQAALDAGARIVNDVTALTGPGTLETVAASQASVILMHMQGTPRDMQANPQYRDVVTDIYDWLSERVQSCRTAGISLDRLAVDPGFGFGKTVDHNAALLARLGLFQGLGCPVAVGLSRKSFIGAWTGEDDPARRVTGSVAAALSAVGQGAQIVRVHDVAETRDALYVWHARTRALL